MEKMNEFFSARVDGYDEHMLGEVEGCREAYAEMARLVPDRTKSLLDLGCGTGLELDYYFKINPWARVTGIDLALGMLAALKKKFSDKDITLIRGSYFDVPITENHYDAVVSVESLHHFTKDEKVPLYRKVCGALKENGYFILTDYLAPSDEEEVLYRSELSRLKLQQGITDNEFYHYDTPLTAVHEIQALQEAGFSSVEILNRWGATYTLKATR